MAQEKKLSSYLEGCASIASLLLHSENAYKQVANVLAMLGQATGACRCYWAELQADPDTRVTLGRQAEWCAPGVENRDNNLHLQSFYKHADSGWYRELAANRIVSGMISDFPEKERNILQAQGIRSILVVPMFIREKFIGLIGLDNCTDEKPWEAAEENLLRFASDSLANAFDREKSFNDLMECEARYREIFENISDFWCLHDMDGRFMEVNPAIEKTLGYSQQELLSMSVLDLVPEHHKPEFEDYMNALKRDGNAGGLLRMITKGGEERILGYRNWLVCLPGGAVAARCLFRDVTERVSLEVRLRHAQKMESIGTFAGGIAHNFRNILAGIRNYAELIRSKYGNESAPGKNADEIIHLVEIGSGLINNILRFSHKTQEIPKTQVNLADVLRKTLDIIRQSFEKHIEIQTEWPETITVYGDPSTLIHVFMNLCANARDAMPDGGILRMAAREERGKIVVKITDNGIGMDEETLKNIYDPFYTTKAPDKGTGLGLSTAYGIIKDHHGEIHVKSQIGLGTSFEVFLPVSNSYVPDDKKGVYEKKSHGNNEKVLLVDDDDFILEPMEEMLTGYGYRTRSAGSGNQAIEEYRSWHPDVVFIDRTMPEMDGLTTLKSIFSMDSKARIVLVSGYDAKGPEGIDEKTRKKIKGYLTKPFDMDEVIRLLSRILKK